MTRAFMLAVSLALGLASSAAATRVEWRFPTPGSLAGVPAGADGALVVHSVAYPNAAEVDELRRFPGRVGVVLWSRLPGPPDLPLLERIPGQITFVVDAYPSDVDLGHLGNLTPPARLVIAGRGMPPGLDPWSYREPLGASWPDRRTAERLARYGLPHLLVLRGSYPDHVMMDALTALPAHARVVLNAAVGAGPPTAARTRDYQVRTVDRGWLFPDELALWLTRDAAGPHRRIAETGEN